ncbi:MAG: family 14 glycosylhydrolase [Candidatus Melainabacteria bacterium]|nr:family 14 glycosylhydrolase [Candidatus Melainabacteria bacterium]
MKKTISVMAPLVVGDPTGIDIKACKDAWREFDKHLAKAKRCGVYAVSTDIWWGLVEKSERHYDWSYYDKLSDHIISAGLKWIAIISLHACGGNAGDTVNIGLPGWIWTKLAARVTSQKITAVQYVSEQGNASSEYVSCWATDLVLPDYQAFFTAFQERFGSKKEHISEINISLGPAGELRYPSYNRHDKDTDYPTRGALQCYSELARQSFVDYVLKKYENIEGARNAWGVLEKIEPPCDASAFFTSRGHVNLQYGRDLFDWYRSSLLIHGRKVLTTALSVFSGHGSSFVGIDLGAKVPGVHWRVGCLLNQQIVLSDRLAELNAGLIASYNWCPDTAYGYKEIVSLFRELQEFERETRVVLHFTCLEMGDGENQSLAHQLVRWLGKEASLQGVPIKGENALNYTLYTPIAWKYLRSALDLYEGLTILRISDAVGCNRIARHEFRKTLKLAAGETKNTRSKAA